MDAPYTGISIKNARRLLMRNFEQAGLDSAAMDARILVGFAAGLSPSDLIARGPEFLSEDMFKTLSAYADQRLAGKPISQIIGYRDFWKDRFIVNEHVLTPRPETEGIIETALTCFKDRAPRSILDLGTGSGAIILSLLGEFGPDKLHGDKLHGQSIQAIGVDISTEALAIARQNSAALSRPCTFIQSNWFEGVEGTFDLIVSNPPYITDAAMSILPRDVAEYEPSLALRGGLNGLGPYQYICGQLTDYLKPQGWVIFEIGYDQGAAVSDLLQEAGLVNVKILPDLQGHDRIIFGQMGMAE